MPEHGPPRIARQFLQEADRYVRRNLRRITCADIWKMYNDLYLDLKEFQGSSNGFTGFSEYLIFRFLYHVMGGRFVRNRITWDLWEFASKTDRRIRIRHNAPVALNSAKNCRPDLVIYEGGRLTRCVQIKVYLTNGGKEVEHELKTLDVLKARHPQMRALLIIFGGLSKRGTVRPALEGDAKKRSGWFSYLVLQDNKELLCEALGKNLRLPYPPRRGRR